MFINCVRLYVADTVDVIDTFVPVIFLYAATARSHDTEGAIFAKNH